MLPPAMLVVRPLIPEGLGLRILIAGIGPLLGEGGGAAAYLDAGEGHGGKVGTEYYHNYIGQAESVSPR